MCISNCVNQLIACSRDWPHISVWAWRLAHTAGLSAWPKMAQRKSGSSCMQGMPAGFPCGMPGMGLLMEGAMQQAAQCGRQGCGLGMTRF